MKNKKCYLEIHKENLIHLLNSVVNFLHFVLKVLVAWEEM